VKDFHRGGKENCGEKSYQDSATARFSWHRAVSGRRYDGCARVSIPAGMPRPRQFRARS